MESYPKHLEKDSVLPEAECRYFYRNITTDCFSPHCHEFYEIFLTVKGVVTHWVNGKNYELPEGSLVFIRPEDVHGFRYDTPDSFKTAYINLAFSVNTADVLFQYLSGDFPAKKLLLCDMPPTAVLSQTEKEWLMEQLRNLNAVNWQDKKALKMRMRVLLADVFVRYFYTVTENVRSGIPLWLTHTLDKMEQPRNFMMGHKRMVELCGKTREHLFRNMKKYYGLAPSEYINNLRINYASNLLLNTDTPILDICFMCGFQSVSYFYKVFKGKYNVSPREFRNKHIMK